jgi:LysR family transcriptional regulator, transcription activator of glutamate synthase operon
MFGMELQTLRWFVSVADGRTVTETAERFHTTQPAVTRGLHRLAEQFDAPLTERDGRRLRLTFAGEIAARAARSALGEIDEAARAVAEANDPARGTIRVGFLNPLGTWLVPRLLLEFHATHPDVRFELRQDGAARILEALLDGSLDLLLSSLPTDSRAHWTPLFAERLRLAVAANHRLAKRRWVRVEELAADAWVVQPPGYGLRQRVEQIAAAAGFEPHIAFEGHDLGTLFALVGAGSGVGLFAATLAPPHGVRLLELRPSQSRAVGLVTVAGRVLPRSAVGFADMVRERAGGIDPVRWAEA